jgi:hypothetical protein
LVYLIQIQGKPLSTPGWREWEEDRWKELLANYQRDDILGSTVS